MLINATHTHIQLSLFEILSQSNMAWWYVRDITCACSYASFYVSTRCARAYARFLCISRRASKRDESKGWSAKRKRKRKREREEKERRSHATSMNASTWRTTPVSRLSWSDHTLFRGKRDHASRKIKFRPWQ